MLESNIISFFKKKGWWSELEIPKYREALEQLELDINDNSSFMQFYLHVEDMPTFMSNGKEVYQLGWFLVNTSLLDYLFTINSIFGLSEHYIPLDSFEGEYGYFYNKDNKKVIRVVSGKQIPEASWDSFDEFLKYFFEIS